eukprot:TRINITY_DN34431_c0_g1_i1.p1 TRINITY_DN34431_c0_g1~~TRINITY_DN34431_c0_g1_i1.p1  ORF type:complete len:196 (-),score=32.59 TRINITY_DN34431_c0_g1_i1:82-669(-)
MSAKSAKVCDKYRFDGDFTITGQPLLLASRFQPWDAGIVLAKYFEREYQISLTGRVLSCLELGSGTGLAGLSLAFLGHQVLLSDVFAEHIEDSRDHISRNLQAISTAGGSVRYEKIDWMALPEDRARFGFFDLVLASDVIWNVALVVPFVKALAWAAAGSRSTEIVLAHKLRNGMCDLTAIANFETLAKQEGADK